MSGEINMTSIIMTNILGIMILLTAILCCKWTETKSRPELVYLNGMIVTVVICCIFDILSSVYDGGSTTLSKAIITLGNTVLFAGTVINSMFFVFFIGLHINGDLKFFHKTFLRILCTASLVLLFVNLFRPIVFDIDESNRYVRTSFYLLFMIMDFWFILDGILTYIFAVKKGGVMKYFPIWNFVFPIVIGSILQSFVYGVSLIWSTTAISVSGFMVCYQLESVYVDPLTGAFNRRYVENLVLKLAKKRNTSEISGLMIDINRFKAINDKFGHESGDQALIQAHLLLKNVSGSRGSVIRYGGDEFLVILNTQDRNEIEDFIDTVRVKLWELNRSKKNKFELDFAIGHGSYESEKETFDEFLNRIDALMYKDKNAE